MDWYTLIHGLVLVLLLSASAFFSGCETAFFSLSPVDMEKMKGQGHPGAGLVEQLLKKPRSLIASVLVGNELVNITAAAVVASMTMHLMSHRPHWQVTLASSLAGATLLLVFGEIAPKTVAVHFNRWYSVRAAGPLSTFMALVAPMRALVLAVADLVTGALGFKPGAPNPPPLNEDGLLTLMEESHSQGLLDEADQRLMKRALNLDDLPVERIMQPIASVYLVEESTPISQVIENLTERPYSRIPVRRGGREGVISGVLYIKDLLPLVGSQSLEQARVLDFLRPAEQVAPGQSAERVLARMRKRRVHIALVTDERIPEPARAVLGIVTLEDILEELVGEIHDEKETATHSGEVRS